MEKILKNFERYSLPYTIHSSYKFKTHAALLLVISMCLICLFIQGILLRILGLVLGVFIACIWIYMGVLKKAFIGSLFLSIVYGLIMYKVKVNFLVIPIIGILWISYAYSKNCRKKINIINRFFIGVLCGLQIYVGLIVVLMMLNLHFIERNGIISAISTCLENIIENPGEYIRYHVYSIVLFLIGAFSGYSSKTMRKIKKIRMHKQN